MVIIQINQQYARIGLNIKEPAIRLHSVQPELKMESSPGQLTMRSPRPKLHIDQRQCFADAGLRTPEMLRDYLLEQAQQDLLEGIGSIAANGDALAKINGPDIIDIIASKSDKKRDYNVTAIPKQPPQITFETFPVEVAFQPGVINYDFQRGRVDNNFEYGRVEVYLLQKNFVRFACPGKLLDATA